MAHAQTIVVYEELPLMFEHFTMMYTQTFCESRLTWIKSGANKQDIKKASHDRRAENNSISTNIILQMIMI